MPNTSSNIVVIALEPGLENEAKSLAERWGLAVSAPRDPAFALQLTAERLQLVELSEDAPGPVYVDFVGGAVGHRHRFGGGRGQTIAKAVGLKGGANPSIVDATAGLGRDAFVLASLGCHVTLLERSAVVAALLEDGLCRAAADSELGDWIGERMHMVHADAVAWMDGLAEADFPDVVYLDPMFPHRQKSALVKKEMRLFQQLVGYDEGEGALLTAALRVARKRVVVKRPDTAPWLDNRKPTMAIEGKKHRFDVYVKAAM